MDDLLYQIDEHFLGYNVLINEETVTPFISTL